MRFLTVTSNPALDTTYLLDRLTPGEINRVSRVLPQPGGKGNNVARILAALGHSPVATGFAGGHTGHRLEDALRAQGVQPDFVPIPAETRVCLTLVEAETGRITEIREPGAPVDPDAAARLLDHVIRLAADADVVVLSGSLPPSLPPDFCAHLIAAVRDLGVFVAFDSSGEPLRHGLTGQPNLIKPNRDELIGLIGPFTDDAAAITAVQTRLIGPILAPNAAVLLSLGPRGALLIHHNHALRAVPPPITPKNTVGCGDALLAGFLDARARGVDDPESLGHAVAVGTAAALQESVGVVNATDIPRIRNGTCISVVSPDIAIAPRVRHVTPPASPSGGMGTPALEGASG